MVSSADSIPSVHNAVGLHYRGTDKQSSSWDSNPITQDEFIELALDFLEARPRAEAIFAATDYHDFVEQLRHSVNLPVINRGNVEFHKDCSSKEYPMEKADRALLDCLLLSRCTAVLETSSALPSFAKVLNPELELYRTGASKMFADIPYFPVAYVSQMHPASKSARETMQATMADDWINSPNAKRFQKPFSSFPRNWRKSTGWQLLEIFTGVD